MTPAVLEKPTFTRDQIVSATVASKEFSALRKRARTSPQYISGRNGIDSVLLDYETYERMYGELQYFRELELGRIAAERVVAADADPDHRPIPFREAIGEDAYEAFEAIDADAISDTELFE